MEIVFFLIAILLTAFMIYAIGRLVYSHQQLLRAYKSSEVLLVTHILFGTMLVLIFFITLCAFNNSIWHLPYLTR